MLPALMKNQDGLGGPSARAPNIGSTWIPEHQRQQHTKAMIVRLEILPNTRL
jgi:hypothetical protein